MAHIPADGTLSIATPGSSWRVPLCFLCCLSGRIHTEAETENNAACGPLSGCCQETVVRKAVTGALTPMRCRGGAAIRQLEAAKCPWLLQLVGHLRTLLLR